MCKRRVVGGKMEVGSKSTYKYQATLAVRRLGSVSQRSTSASPDPRSHGVLIYVIYGSLHSNKYRKYIKA